MSDVATMQKMYKTACRITAFDKEILLISWSTKMTFLSQELTNIWKLLIEVFPSLDFFSSTHQRTESGIQLFTILTNGTLQAG